MEVKIPYKPRNWAKRLHNCMLRWIVLVLHRRAGKTTAVINHLIRDALKRPKTDYAYIGPTYKQAKRIAWKMLKYYTTNIPGVKFNEVDLSATFPNFSTITLFGSENYDALRGIGLDGCALDENSQQPTGIFGEVISKCLADRLGYCIWLGTPRGKNQFYRTFMASQQSKDYLSIIKTVDDSFREEEGQTIQNLKQALEDDKKLIALGEMTQEEYEQEWFCSFTAAIKGAYYLKELSDARRSGRIKIVPYDKELKVHTVWDLGTGNRLAIGFYQKLGNEPRMIDFWEGSNTDGIIDAIRVLQNEKKYLYGKHFAPHDINATEISTGKTRRETAKTYGINFEEIPRMSVADGIHAGQLFFARLFIDERQCEKFLDAVAQYRQEWNDKRKMFMDTPFHDWTSHASDVHRYAAIVEKKMNNEMQKKQKAPPPLPPRSEYQGGQASEEPQLSDNNYEPRWDSQG